MSSIIKGYNYDIFISYRQKDNKGDRWVSEFVDALKDELEATFKEEVSVYFDINPHDGLLETHDVDESLKEKLKCLVFIPIISRTYCDPKSFAWEHEFKVFVEQASEDQFGLKVKLPGGNVANRVLPVLIHDLDKEDIKLCESVIGGVIRGIEFIYKEPGVNRPLRPVDDRMQNLVKTDYRNQVNKVANAIKDVLNSLTTKELLGDEAITEAAKVAEDKSISTKRPIRKKVLEVPSVIFLYKLKKFANLSRKAWRIAAVVLFCLLLSLGTFWLARKTAPTPSDRPLIRYDIPLTGILGRTGRQAITLSRDGEFLVYVMNEELNLKSLKNSDVQSVPIPGTTNARHPFLSPDDKWIGFENWVDRKIMKVQQQGGVPIPICDLDGEGFGINWQGNEIIFADQSNRIYRVPDSGGSPEFIYPLNKSKNDPRIWNPQLLPDNKTLLFSQELEDGSWDIRTWQLGSKESPVVLVDRGRDGRFLNSGHIVYTMNNLLYIRKFDPKTNRFISEPQIIETRPIAETPWSAASQFDFSENGILVYYERDNRLLKHLVWIDSSDSITRITKEAKDYDNPAISSDAQKIAAVVSSYGDYQIEIIDTKLGISQLFVEDAQYPVWSADNSSIIYVTGNQVFQNPIDQSTPPVILFKLDSASYIELGNLSLDGRYLPLQVTTPSSGPYDIGYYDMLNDTVEMLEHYNTNNLDIDPVISPDGKWLAYVSDYSGQKTIYVAPFPGPGEKRKVSLDRKLGSVENPGWAPDQTALYYQTNLPDYELWEVKVQTSGEFSHEEAQSIFNSSNIRMVEHYIHPDGDRFLGVQYEEYVTQDYRDPEIKVIVNWEQELTDK